MKHLKIDLNDGRIIYLETVKCDVCNSLYSESAIGIQHIYATCLKCNKRDEIGNVCSVYTLQSSNSGIPEDDRIVQRLKDKLEQANNEVESNPFDSARHQYYLTLKQELQSILESTSLNSKSVVGKKDD